MQKGNLSLSNLLHSSVGNFLTIVHTWLFLCSLSQAARILHRLIEPVTVHEGSASPDEVTSGDEASKLDITNPAPLVDYSNLFGEDFQLLDDHWDSSYLNILDIGVVEEGILHVLYACASQVS